MSGILLWLVTGAGVGVIGRRISRVKDPDGALLTVLIGRAGALLGGFLSVATEFAGVGDTTALIAAAIVAVATIGLKQWSVRYEQKTRIKSQPDDETKLQAHGR